MKAHLLALALLSLPLACGSTPEPVAPETPPPPPPPAASAVAPPPPVQEAPKPPELSAEEKKKIEDARQLAEDRAEWEKEAAAEDKRWTPALHAQAKTLAAAKPGSLSVRLKPVLTSKHRAPGHAARDQYRHPLETLQFFGMKPTMTVLEYGPGEGWYTEILAPTLLAKGSLHVTSPDPNGPPDSRGTFYAERLKRFLNRVPELYGKVTTVVTDSKAPNFGTDEQLDMILALRTMHGMVKDNTLGLFLEAAHKALKKGGILAVEQHRAKPDAKPEESAKKGYLPEAWLIEQIEAAGFKLADKSEINANPKDTKDYEEGVWALPPTYKMKEKDRAKYTEIGESDRMTLKFTKAKLKKKKEKKEK